MLSPWITWLLRRNAQYRNWVENGEPKVMWLSGLHIPETYIAALVQTACRDCGWPLDKSTIYTKVRSQMLLISLSFTYRDLKAYHFARADYEVTKHFPLSSFHLPVTFMTSQDLVTTCTTFYMF